MNDDSDIQDLQAFFNELRGEKDRGMAVLRAALLDEQLAETLRAFLRDGEVVKKMLDPLRGGAFGSFLARIDACNVLGLIDDWERAELAQIAKVRNAWSHLAHGTSFDSPVIETECRKLQSVVLSPHDPNSPRDRYFAAVRWMASALVRRHRRVASQKRKEIIWVTPEQRKPKTLPPGARVAPVIPRAKPRGQLKKKP